MGENLELFLSGICDRRPYIIWIFALALMFLIVQVPYLFVVEPGDPLYVVSVMNVVGFSIFAVVSGIALLYCREH